MTEAATHAELVRRGMSADAAALYVEAWREYRQAAAHVLEHGILIEHPRTGTPIENPYVAIRDRASARLRRLAGKVDVGFLWAADGGR